MEEFVVGDRIVVCTVDEMLESGLFYDRAASGVVSGDIILDATYSGSDYAFNRRMQYLCGQTGVISQIDRDGHRWSIKIEFDDPSITLKRADYDDTTWYISPGMIKHCAPAVSDEDMTSFLNEF